MHRDTIRRNIETLTVNHPVVGSSPTREAIFYKACSDFRYRLFLFFGDCCAICCAINPMWVVAFIFINCHCLRAFGHLPTVNIAWPAPSYNPPATVPSIRNHESQSIQNCIATNRLSGYRTFQTAVSWSTHSDRRVCLNWSTKWR